MNTLIVTRHVPPQSFAGLHARILFARPGDALCGQSFDLIVVQEPADRPRDDMLEIWIRDTLMSRLNTRGEILRYGYQEDD